MDHFQVIMAAVHNHFLNMSIKYSGKTSASSKRGGNGVRNNVRFFLASNSEDIKTELLRYLK